MTFQALPLHAAAALEVQEIIQKDNLMENVSKRGGELEQLLRAGLGSHSYVGDIRGRGLFWGGIEFVKYNKTKEPFYNQIKVAYAIKEWAISKFNIAVYPSTGCVDGVKGGGCYYSCTCLQYHE